MAVTSSDNSPSGTTGWIVYPNNFPTQQVELYYDLPAYNYPTEYHHDNQTNAVMTVVAGSTVPSCNPTPITQSLQTSTLTYQFCYQAYQAASGSVPAWQVAIQGQMVTQNTLTRSNISGQTGFYILSVSGTRYQSINSAATTSVPIVGQTWHNSGGGDANEFKDDPLLLQAAPHLVAGYGLVLYTGSLFMYPNGMNETVDNYYAKVDSDPLIVSGTSVVEQGASTPDWSAFQITCGSSSASCPLPSASSRGVSDYTLTSSGGCPGGPGQNAAAHVAVQFTAVVSVAVAAFVAMLW